MAQGVVMGERIEWPDVAWLSEEQLDALADLLVERLRIRLLAAWKHEAPNHTGNWPPPPPPPRPDYENERAGPKRDPDTHGHKWRWGW